MRRPKYLSRQTKIVATIGPASGTAAVVERLIKSGMNCARFNLSHGRLGDHTGYIDTVRKLAQRFTIPVTILLDLAGPKYRTGGLRSGSAMLKRGSQFTLTTRQIEGDETMVSVNYPNLAQDVKVAIRCLLMTEHCS